MSLFTVDHGPYNEAKHAADPAWSANMFVRPDSRCIVCGGLLMNGQAAWYYDFAHGTIFAHQQCLRRDAVGIARDMLAMAASR